MSTPEPPPPQPALHLTPHALAAPELGGGGTRRAAALAQRVTPSSLRSSPPCQRRSPRQLKLCKSPPPMQTTTQTSEILAAALHQTPRSRTKPQTPVTPRTPLDTGGHRLTAVDTTNGCPRSLAGHLPGPLNVQRSRFNVQGSRFHPRHHPPCSRLTPVHTGYHWLSLQVRAPHPLPATCRDHSAFKVRGSRFKVQGSRFAV